MWLFACDVACACGRACACEVAFACDVALRLSYMYVMWLAPCDGVVLIEESTTVDLGAASPLSGGQGGPRSNAPLGGSFDWDSLPCWIHNLFMD